MALATTIPTTKSPWRLTRYFLSLTFSVVTNDGRKHNSTPNHYWRSRPATRPYPKQFIVDAAHQLRGQRVYERSQLFGPFRFAELGFWRCAWFYYCAACSLIFCLQQRYPNFIFDVSDCTYDGWIMPYISQEIQSDLSTSQMWDVSVWLQMWLMRIPERWLTSRMPNRIWHDLFLVCNPKLTFNGMKMSMLSQLTQISYYFTR